MRVLVVEDDPDLSEILRDGLVEEGYAVDLSTDGEDGLWRATTVEYDVALLDVMLPDMTGFDILREMRRRGSASPVLFLTARDATEDRVRGLDLGADDYLVKPFEWDELLARLRALVRRGGVSSPSSLAVGDLDLDPARHAVTCAGEPLHLTPTEFEIVYVLLRDPGRAFSRTELLERVWDDGHDAYSNTVDVLVSRIRKKLAAAGSHVRIRTVRGVGYALAA